MRLWALLQSLHHASSHTGYTDSHFCWSPRFLLKGPDEASLRTRPRATWPAPPAASRRTCRCGRPRAPAAARPRRGPPAPHPAPLQGSLNPTMCILALQQLRHLAVVPPHRILRRFRVPKTLPCESSRSSSCAISPWSPRTASCAASGVLKPYHVNPRAPAAAPPRRGPPAPHPAPLQGSLNPTT